MREGEPNIACCPNEDGVGIVLKVGDSSVRDGDGGKVGQVEEDNESDRALNNGGGALCKDSVEINVGGSGSGAVGGTGVGINKVDGTLGDVEGFGKNVKDCGGDVEVH